jgi:type I restriction enzyme S subunit
VIPATPYFLHYCYFAFKGLKEQMEAIGGGATMGNVNKSKFEQLELLKPSMSVLREFSDFCTLIFEQIKNLSLQNIKLKVARDILLPRLMNGEITV